MLGHSRLDTTAIYNHMFLGQHIDAVERMQEILGAGPSGPAPKD
jgi:site-specific recombinase XerD